MDKATIMEIQRFSIHDGPGIRTTVFFKGCHMRCLWCHNPESHEALPELMFFDNKCIGCGKCMELCHKNAHSIVEGKHVFQLSYCRTCDKKALCAENCAAQAIKLCGQEFTAEELMEQVLLDKSFYQTEGGVTLSGGEALLQTEFLTEFLPLCKENEISVCMDTTLNLPFETWEKLLPWIDIFLVDIKFLEEKKHMEYTKTEGHYVKENLIRLSDLKIPVILRMPIVAGINDTKEELELRKRFIKGLHNVKRIDCFPVGNHAASKYKALQKEMMRFNEGASTKELMEWYRRELGIHGEENLLSC